MIIKSLLPSMNGVEIERPLKKYKNSVHNHSGATQPL